MKKRILPRVAVPPKAFDVQAQHARQSANPKALRGSLFLLARPAMIQLRLGELFDGHETR